jgi:hypothetical protein
MKKSLITLLIASFLLSGCSQGSAPKIVFEDSFPYCYVGEAYDIHDVLNVQTGVSYTFEATYQDYYTLKDNKIEVQDYSFTQEVKFDVHLIVYASNGGAKSEKSIDIPVKYRGDQIDEYFSNGGQLSWCDPGFSKELTQDSDHMHSSTSKSAIDVSYIGSNSYTWGAGVFSLTNFRLADLWSDKSWENAIVSFYVFNPSAYPIDFQLRVYDVYTGLVNTDWAYDLEGASYRQVVAKSGVWTHCAFSLRKIGITHLLTLTEDYSRKDELSIKCRYEGAPDPSAPKVYSYSYYIDDIDVVPASSFPEVDTTRDATDETVAKGWENMPLDSHWMSSPSSYDFTSKKGEGSDCSLKASFPSPHTDNFVALNIEESVNTFQSLSVYPDFTSGTLKGYFRFDDVDPAVTVGVQYENSTKDGWISSVRKTMSLGAKDNEGWYEGSLDVSTLVPSEGHVLNLKPLRLCFYFSNVNLYSIVHLDTITFQA